jgi:hypothetical protein
VVLGTFLPAFGPSEQLPAEEVRKPWLVLTDNSPLASAIVERLRASGARVSTVVSSGHFAERGELSFAIDPPAQRTIPLMEALREQNAVPAHVVHLWALAPRPRRFWFLQRRRPCRLGTRGGPELYGLLFLSQALAFEVDQVRLTAIGTAIEALPGEREVHPEKAALMGVCRVLPREMPGASCSILMSSCRVQDPAKRSGRSPDQRTNRSQATRWSSSAKAGAGFSVMSRLR